MTQNDELYPRERYIRSVLEPRIAQEYIRVMSEFTDPDRYIYIPGAYFLNISDVLRAHFLIANHFLSEGQELVGLGPRDCGLLESAIYRQVASFNEVPKWKNKFEVCATLFFGLIMNHPFHDANKRTAFLSLLYQLDCQGWCPAVDERVFEDFTVTIADNKLQECEKYSDVTRKYNEDQDIHYIAFWIRKHVRKIDKTKHAVTYRQLKSILNKFGFSLENPWGNQIDVVSMHSGTHYAKTRICQIGFPRWSAEVPQGDLKIVKQMTGLAHADGVDSEAFYGGQDPMQNLISTYHEPLMRLAAR